jgi:hypothetical protein
MRLTVRVISVLTLILCIFSCTQEQREKISDRLRSSSDENEKIIKSTEGCCVVSVPGSWNEEKELNAKANMQAANRLKELYIIVISEPKEDFEEMTLENHSELTRAGFMKSLKGAQITGPVSLTVNKNPAVQYEISGSSNNVKIVALHTTIESEKYYHQILAWTIKSRIEKNKPILQKVVQSFKEVSSPKTGS